MPFACSICEEQSTAICVHCTKDTCRNHLCEKCHCCSDCCGCDVPLTESHPDPTVSAATGPKPEPAPEPPHPPPDPDPFPDPFPDPDQPGDAWRP